MPAAHAAIVDILKRDRLIVIAALAFLTLLGWTYVLSISTPMMTPAPVSEAPTDATLSDGMAGMEMAAGPGDADAGDELAGMTRAVGPGFRPWGLRDFAFTFAMWSVMMVGMMTPSVAPMVLLYAAVGRKAAANGTPFSATGWFVAGYIAVWIGFSAIATAAQWALTSLALLTPMMATASSILGGGVLVVAGIYQWTSLKRACLTECQSPLGFLQSHGGFRADAGGALYLGIVHGGYCLGCCVALMALLFVGGIMNVLWIAGLTVLILLEKVLPFGPVVPRISGTFIAIAGIWLLVGAG